MQEDIKSISPIIDYPIDENGHIVTRRSGVSRMKPRLDAPPPSQPGSVDWTMQHLFGSTHKAVMMVESMVAGQGENADEKWIKFCLLYRKWEQEGLDPTLNQVCYSLNLSFDDFLLTFQNGLQSLMRSMAHMKAALAVPEIMDNLTELAKTQEADVKQIELALKIGGVIDEKGGFNVQINNSNNQAVLLKSEKDRMKSPLLQFHDTVVDIDNEVRREDEHK